MKNKRQFITVLAAIFVCLAIIGSFVFIAASAEHECTHDDDCTICCLIDVCINAIRSGFSGSAMIFAAAVFAALSVIAVCVTGFLRSPATLITLKTELRN